MTNLPIFSTQQLHILQQQIESLRKISSRMKAMKYEARTGKKYSVALPSDHVVRKAGVVSPFKKSAMKARLALSSEDKVSGKDDVEDDASNSTASKSSADEPYSQSSNHDDVDHDSSSKRRRKRPKITVATLNSDRPSRNRVIKNLHEDTSSELSHSEEEEEQRFPSPPLSHTPNKERKRAGVKHITDRGSSEDIILPLLNPVSKEWPGVCDAACTVCGDAESVEGDAILMCEGTGCQVFVHQSCYGIKTIPVGEWLCDGCQHKLKPDAANCILCPVVGGAVRKVSSAGCVKSLHKPSFVHMTCALWTPEITLERPESMEGITLVGLTPARVALACSLCKQAGGAVVQCSFGTCCRAFHVLCGHLNKQVHSFRITDGEPMAFCSLHSTKKFADGLRALLEGKEMLCAGQQTMDEG